MCNVSTPRRPYTLYSHPLKQMGDHSGTVNFALTCSAIFPSDSSSAMAITERETIDLMLNILRLEA